MIKAAIFDVGNVLYKIDQDGFIKELTKKYGKGYKLFRTIERDERIKLDFGAITDERYLQNIESALKIKIDQKEYYHLFFSKYVKLNRGLLKIIGQLKKQKYKLFILSNNNKPFYRFMKKKNNVLPFFDKVLISFQVRLKKPNPLFLKKLLTGTGIKKNECIFIDDRADHITWGKSLGMKGIVYKTNKMLETELIQLKIIKEERK